MKTKKFLFSAIAVMAMAFCQFLMGCSKDDGDVEVNVYEDNVYGIDLINACVKLGKELESAYAVIDSTKLSKHQEDYLQNVVVCYLKKVVRPSCKQLANDVESLENVVDKMDATTITQDQVDEACSVFKKSREDWKLTEAFQMGAVIDYYIDRIVDSWPVNMETLQDYLCKAMNNYQHPDKSTDISNILMRNSGSIVGFHALEFMLFRNGENRDAKELRETGYDTDSTFNNVNGTVELNYIRKLCNMLKLRSYQLYYSWQQGIWDHEDSRMYIHYGSLDTLKAGGLGYKDFYGRTYSFLLLNPGPNSVYANRKDVISQILCSERGSCASIVNEIALSMITRPLLLGNLNYVEAPYSHGTVKDMRDNILSVRNVWYGSTDGTIAENSFARFFEDVLKQPVGVEAAINDVLQKIDALPQPFVKYCNTVWGKEPV